MTYHEYEQAIFDWLMSKHEKDENFRFSTRQKAAKGAKTDIFIGTQKSNYFGVTFWSVRTAYPGSATDLVSLIFAKEGNKFTYRFEVVQTRSPHNPQNQGALEVARKLRKQDSWLWERAEPNPEVNKMEYTSIRSPEQSYDSIELLLADLEKDLPEFIAVVDGVIEEVKGERPGFTGGPINEAKFDHFLNRLEARREKYGSASLTELDEQGLEEEASSESYDDGEEIYYPLNQILYGPPGTGKTYRTITDAVKIVNPFFNVTANNRVAWTEEYQRLVQEGRIVFTTFHQSLSYEDFVEGIKPETTEEGQVTYDERLGIFRSLCTEAAYAIHQRIKTGKQTVELDYGDRFDAYLAYVQEMLEEEKPIKLLTKAGKGAEIVGITDRGNIQVKHDNGEGLYTISKDRQVRLDEGITDFDDLPGNIYTVFASIIGGSNASMHWAVMNAVRKFTPPAKVETKVKLNLKAKAKAIKTLTSEDFQHPAAPNYVLIIDEINRGNVSRIFGELITLLEPDKRLGREEALTVTLPYSRDPFGVPPNLYLIGTMNTADRSVVALDSALRRRFRFVEVPPEPEVLTENGRTDEVIVNGKPFYLKVIMTAINERIEFLRDRDHLIGHSYFLKMKTAADVAEQFTTGIIPLLREYFYEDYGQLLLIFGEGFIGEKKGKKLVSLPTGVKNNDLGLNEYRKYTVESFLGENGQLDEGKLAAGLDVLLGEKKQEG